MDSQIDHYIQYCQDLDNKNIQKGQIKNDHPTNKSNIVKKDIIKLNLLFRYVLSNNNKNPYFQYIYILIVIKQNYGYLYIFLNFTNKNNEYNSSYFF